MYCNWLTHLLPLLPQNGSIAWFYFLCNWNWISPKQVAITLTMPMASNVAHCTRQRRWPDKPRTRPWARARARASRDPSTLPQQVEVKALTIRTYIVIYTSFGTIYIYIVIYANNATTNRQFLSVLLTSDAGSAARLINEFQIALNRFCIYYYYYYLLYMCIYTYTSGIGIEYYMELYTNIFARVSPSLSLSLCSRYACRSPLPYQCIVKPQRPRNPC